MLTDFIVYHGSASLRYIHTVWTNIYGKSQDLTLLDGEGFWRLIDTAGQEVIALVKLKSFEYQEQNLGR